MPGPDFSGEVLERFRAAYPLVLITTHVAEMTLDVYGGLYDEDLERLADRLGELHDSYCGPGAAQADSADMVRLDRAKRLPRSD